MNNNIYIPQTTYLKTLLRSIWQVEGFPGFKTETILPKGNVEIIFNFSEGNPIVGSLNNKKFQLVKCFINGFNTSPIQLQLPQKHVFVGVQFHPVAIKQLFGVPASEFTNLITDLTLVNHSFNALWHLLAEEESFTDRVRVITDWIEDRVIHIQPRDQFLNSFLSNDLQQSVSVSQLAKNVCYSPRQLSRKIYALAGLNAEDILLYKKFLRSVHFIQHSNLPLTDIAYESHFSDQSHFIKSFKLFAHITPGEYRQTKSFVEGHIFEDVR